MPIMPARLGGRPADAIKDEPRLGAPSLTAAVVARACIVTAVGGGADLEDRARTGAAKRAAAEMVMEAILVVVVRAREKCE